MERLKLLHFLLLQDKKTQQTPKQVIDICKKRIKDYDNE